ncbi:hypothetical protein ACFSE0_07605 [Ochrobactrum teleogrylli]|uniref:Winged helix domain-containing protein n=1 Tax=Ochrobactrum teleogrylli TaxID=2479765 RepID=A0ABY2Y345_9HYPH|nr:hypothetical protein [[Ochrobactrum] teleogrylli]TNV13254.1 hypothetical protein FIC94_16090 [[Ochrobactrum] teleogrylli]
MSTDKERWASAAFAVTNGTSTPFTIAVKGRDRWALESLINAGKAGCTPIDHPGPRWSAYVFKLRGFGVDIETIHEKHEGSFSGTHARYVLHSAVTPFDKKGAAA